jgi:hypothetical protein
MVSSTVARLSTQLGAVKQVMADGNYRTLEEIAGIVYLLTGKKATEASISARLRDLRKERFGGYKVDRMSVGAGLFKYRVN